MAYLSLIRFYPKATEQSINSKQSSRPTIKYEQFPIPLSHPLSLFSRYRCRAIPVVRI